MANTARLDDLTTKHEKLEIMIEEEMARPLADSLKVSELKREKLRIKEEISNIELTAEAV